MLCYWFSFSLVPVSFCVATWMRSAASSPVPPPLRLLVQVGKRAGTAISISHASLCVASFIALILS